MGRYSKHLASEIADSTDSRLQAANPAVREMISHLGESGIETVFDRLDAQQPQCGFGLRGVCCQMCQWGPCRFTTKSPRGVCGRTVEMISVSNMARAAAAGTSAQMIHAREMILTLLAAVRGEIDLPLKGTHRLREVGNALKAGYPWTPLDQIAERVGEIMLKDLERASGSALETLNGFAPRELRAFWSKAGLQPRSAAVEVMETLHITTLGGSSDWHSIFEQAIRTSLAYAYSGLVTSSVLSEVLYGSPEIQVLEVNYGVLKPDHVNILVHGHSPIVLEKVLEKIDSPEIQALARELGAEGIVVGGMCCTGHELLARHGVPSVTGVLGQELVLGTGAVDAVVVDMQCILPGMEAVAACFGTELITTCHSNRIPGATHIPFDPEQPQTLDDDALRIARTAVEAFGRRNRSTIRIPEHTSQVMAGFTRETLLNSFGGVRPLVGMVERGDIRGVVGMVGCSSPKSACETSHVAIARELIAADTLVLASGCSAHALLNAGLCSTDAIELAGPGLRAACQEAGVPPVLVVGGCSDNTRIIQVFAGMAHQAEMPIRDMPFVLSGPELAHEKPMGQLLAVLAHGVSAVVGLSPNLPIPNTAANGEPGPVDPSMHSELLTEFFCGEGLTEMLGSRLLVQPDPAQAAQVILAVLDGKRTNLGWNG